MQSKRTLKYFLVAVLFGTTIFGAQLTEKEKKIKEQLSKAIQYSNLEDVKNILESNSDMDLNRFGSLDYALFVSGNSDIIKQLLEHGADPNQPNIMLGELPLSIALNSLRHTRNIHGWQSPGTTTENKEKAQIARKKYRVTF